MRRILFLASSIVAALVGLLVAVSPAQAIFEDVQVNHILPNSTVDSSSGDGIIQADISEACPSYNQDGCAGGGRAIQAPKAFIKLYFNDPDQIYVRIMKGSGSSYPDPSKIEFDFVPAKADDTLDGDPGCQVGKFLGGGSSSDFFHFTGGSSWSDPTLINFDPTCRPKRSLITHLYTVQVTARFTNTSNDRWFNFKVDAYSSGCGTGNANFPCDQGKNAAGLWARVNQNDSPVVLDTMNTNGSYQLRIPFGAPCDQTVLNNIKAKSGFVDPNLGAFLQWQDADGDVAPPAGTGVPANPGVFFDVYYKDGNDPNSDFQKIPNSHYGGTGVNPRDGWVGGNGKNHYQFLIPNAYLKVGYKYIWVWKNITYNNDPQIWIPFDSVLYNQSCPTKSAKKVYVGNYINIPQSALADNTSFQAAIGAYIWADAGIRSRGSDKTSDFWLAGTWGASAGDTDQTDSSNLSDLNVMTSFNSEAESGCPGAFGTGCLQRLPLAYVPFRDSTGDSSPGGNNWQPIRDETFTASNPSNQFTPRNGGFACQTGTYQNEFWDCGANNKINGVEISNIHIQVTNTNFNTTIQNWQGGIACSKLQADNNPSFTNPPGCQNDELSLPAGSQGPIGGSGNPQNAWDNIKQVSDTIPRVNGTKEFTNPVDPNNQGNATVHNFGWTNNGGSVQPDGSGMENIFKSFAVTFGSVNSTTRLQDGNDLKDHPPYQNASEPITYTAGIADDNADHHPAVQDAQLTWDEYVNWSQQDDKGHYYPTRSNVPVGFNLGAATTIGGTSTGVSYDPGDPGFGNSPTTSCISNLDYSYAFLHFNIPGTQSKFGWELSDATQMAHPGGSPGYFGTVGDQPLNPAWAQVNGIWQDPNITTMDNSGDSTPITARTTWVKDQTDPLYSNKSIYSVDIGWPVATGYPNDGSHTLCATVYPGGHLTKLKTTGLKYYQSLQGQLHPADSCPTNYVGTCNQSNDNKVQTDWDWVQNPVQVRYEQTFDGHTRDLGCYAVNTDNFPSCSQLYGLGSSGSASAPLPARAGSTIYNPGASTSCVNGTVSSCADLFAAGNINSYFKTSNAQSAFVFAGGTIVNNFDRDCGASTVFCKYKNNAGSGHATNGFTPIAGYADAAHYVFRNTPQGDFDAFITAAKCFDSGTNTYGGTFDVSKGFGNKIQANRIWTRGKNTGVGCNNGVAADRVNLTLNATTICNSGANNGLGSATIVVTGDLTINGNITLCKKNSSTNQPFTVPSQLPSISFIVLGDINVAGGVTELDGAYFSNGTFDTGTNGGAPNDPVLLVKGIAIAGKFALSRQPDGPTLQANSNVAEKFRYDPTVVIDPPPGWTSVSVAPAPWNEAVPFSH